MSDDVKRDDRVAELLRRATERFGADDKTGTIDALRRALGILDPPTRGGATTAEDEAHEIPGVKSRDEIPAWMEKKR